MTRERMPDFVEISEGHVIATRGIMSIKQQPGFVEVRYISGYVEEVMEISMVELLTSLGRNPLLEGRTDSR